MNSGYANYGRDDTGTTDEIFKNFYRVIILERLDGHSHREISRRVCIENGISWSKFQDLVPKTVEYSIVDLDK